MLEAANECHDSDHNCSYEKEELRRMLSFAGGLSNIYVP